MFLNALVYMVETKDTAAISVDTWFNLLGTILGAVIGGFIAYYVAKSQIKEQSFIDDKRERSTITLNFKLNTYLEIDGLLNKYSNEVSKIHEDLSKYYLGYISDKEHKEKFKLDFDSRISGIRREINSKMLLVPELKTEHAELDALYTLYSTMVYKHYEGKENELLDSLKGPFSEEETPEELKEMYLSYLENPIKEIDNIYQNHVAVLDKITIGIISLMKIPVDELMK